MKAIKLTRMGYTKVGTPVNHALCGASPDWSVRRKRVVRWLAYLIGYLP